MQAPSKCGSQGAGTTKIFFVILRRKNTFHGIKIRLTLEVTTHHIAIIIICVKGACQLNLCAMRQSKRSPAFLVVFVVFCHGKIVVNSLQRNLVHNVGIANVVSISATRRPLARVPGFARALKRSYRVDTRAVGPTIVSAKRTLVQVGAGCPAASVTKTFQIYKRVGNKSTGKKMINQTIENNFLKNINNINYNN